MLLVVLLEEQTDNGAASEVDFSQVSNQLLSLQAPAVLLLLLRQAIFDTLSHERILLQDFEQEGVVPVAPELLEQEWVPVLHFM